MQDSKINGALAIIGYVTAAISVILTSIFMLKLGGDDKFLQGLFLVLGASLDIVKHILPIVIFYALARKQWGFSAILSVVYCAMTVISFNASASTLEERITTNLQSSTQSAVNLAQIELLKKELEDKRILFAEQKSANQVSKMDITSDEISNLNRKIVDLISNTTVTTQESVLASQKDIIIYACAGLIEVFSLTIMLCVLKLDGFLKKNSQEEELLNLLKVNEGAIREIAGTTNPLNVEINQRHQRPNCHKQNKSQVKEHEGNTQSQSQPFTQASVSRVEEITQDEGKLEVEEPSIASSLVKEEEVGKISSTLKIKDSVVEAMEKAIKEKKVKPNFRAVQSAFRLSRDEVRECFQILNENGTLFAGKGNRYYLADS